VTNSISDPAGAAYSAPTDPLAGFKGPISKKRGGKRREWREGSRLFFSEPMDTDADGQWHNDHITKVDKVQQPQDVGATCFSIKKFVLIRPDTKTNLRHCKNTVIRHPLPSKPLN